MQYTGSLPFKGNSDKAFGLAESALTALGFRLTQRTASSLEMTGPGMNSSRESVLVGASRVHVNKGNGELTMEADLGGVQRMTRFVMLFPITLCLFLALLFGVVFTVANGPGNWMFAVAGAVGVNALTWMILGPWMARRFHKRTCDGLDTLLANMVAVGEAA